MHAKLSAKYTLSAEAFTLLIIIKLGGGSDLTSRSYYVLGIEEGHAFLTSASGEAAARHF